MIRIKLSDKDIKDVGIRGIFISNYVEWSGNNNAAIAKEYGFKENSEDFQRTYRKISNLDDMHENGIHDYMKFIKFGYGRATDHACKDIRDGVIDRDSGIEIIKKMDHVKPNDLIRWLKYVDMKEDDFDKDSEKFYNPKITNVLTTLDGKPNQLFSSGMKPQNHFSEIQKYFGDGRYRTNAHVSKELELSDVGLGDYATDKYGLWLDMRSTDHESLFGTGRKIEGSSQSIHIQIEKTAEAAGALTAYVYYIHDSQLNFEDGKLINIVN